MLTPAKQAALQAIRSSWKIPHVCAMFSAEMDRTFLQNPANDDFFEEATLALLQRLAELTEDRREWVRVRLRERWGARIHHRRDGLHEAGRLKVGGSRAVKNENLRLDVEEFVREVEEGPSQESASAKRSSGDGDDTRPTKRQTRSGAVRTAPRDLCGTEHESESEDEEQDDDEPEDDIQEDNETEDDAQEYTVSSSSSDDAEHPHMPYERALATIKTAWPARSAKDEPFDFSILPQHAYRPYTDYPSRPFYDERNLLHATYRLARATRGRRPSVQRALRRQFVSVRRFNEDVASKRIRRVARRFERGDGGNGVARIVGRRACESSERVCGRKGT